MGLEAPLHPFHLSVLGNSNPYCPSAQGHQVDQVVPSNQVDQDVQAVLVLQSAQRAQVILADLANRRHLSVLTAMT